MLENLDGLYKGAGAGMPGINKSPEIVFLEYQVISIKDISTVLDEKQKSWTSRLGFIPCISLFDFH